MDGDARSEYSGYQSWKNWDAGTFGDLDDPSRVYFDAELRACGLSDLDGASVLEIGFGNGAFATWVSSHGGRYQGTEQIPDLLKAGAECGLDVHDASEPLDSFIDARSLDLVAAYDVFEHLDLPQLREFLTAIRRSLKASGLLLARVPSGDSPFARAIQHGDLTHQLILGSSAIEQLSDELGFEVVQIREPAYPVSGLGVISLARRVIVRGIRAIIHPLLASVLMGDRRFVLTPTLVFVLRPKDPSASPGEFAS